MKKNLHPGIVSCIFMLMIISELVSSCSKSIESPEIEIFMEDLPVQIVGMTFDSNGDMYVGTIENQDQKRILKITPDGKISSFKFIKCLAVEYLKAGKNNAIYVSVITDNAEGGAQIVKIAQDTTMSLVSEGFIQPVGITFDLEDNLFVIDAMKKQVYKITPSNEKSVFIDLTMNQNVPDNLYHGIDFDSNCKYLFVAGLNSGGTGNLVKYPINNKGEPDEPIIISDHYSKHVTVHNNAVYSTIDNSSLLIINEDGSQNLLNDPLLKDGMNLSFGRKKSGENTLYINTFNKIVKVIL